MVRLSTLPQCEVTGISFLLSHLDPSASLKILEFAASQLAILGETIDREVDVPLYLVGMPGVDQILDPRDDLRNMSCGPRRDIRTEDAQGLHILLEAVDIGINDLKWVQALTTSTSQDAILPSVQEVTHISVVAHMTHPVTAMSKIADDNVHGNVSLGVAEM
jgi:hypothetical protein